MKKRPSRKGIGFIDPSGKALESRLVRLGMSKSLWAWMDKQGTHSAFIRGLVEAKRKLDRVRGN